MIQQKDNKSVRATISHETDVVKIKDYYEVHGHFPIFRQVLIETRTDCNNHCKFCPHAFNKKDFRNYVMGVLQKNYRSTLRYKL